MVGLVPRPLLLSGPVGVPSLHNNQTGLINWVGVTRLSALLSSSSWNQPSVRSFSKVKDSAVTEVYFEEIFEHGFAGEDPLSDHRNYLYPDSEDPNIQALATAPSINDVFAIIEEIGKPSPQHIAQALATVFHFQKLCNFKTYDFLNEVRESYNSFNAQLRESQGFQHLLTHINKSRWEYGFLEIAFSLMVIRKLGVPLSDRLMQNLYVQLINNSAQLDLRTLSYLTVALRPRIYGTDHVNTWKFGLIPIIPRLSEHLENCSTPKDLKSIAICFYTMPLLISDKMMQRFKSKFEELVSANLYQEDENIQTLNKLLSLVLTKADWHSVNQDYVHLLLQQHKGRVHKINPIHATLLSRVLKIYGHPVSLFEEVYDRLCEMLHREGEYLDVGGIPNISVLSHVVQMKKHALPIQEVKQQLRGYLGSEHISGNLEAFISIIKSVGITDKSIIDPFFAACFQVVKDNRQEVRHLATRINGIRTINNGFYKNNELLAEIGDVLETNIQTWYTPADFSEHLGLLLSFGRNIPDNVKETFFRLLPRLNAYSLFAISLGIRDQLWKQKRLKQGIRKRDFQDVSYQSLDEMSLGLQKASHALLDDPHTNLSLSELGLLLRCHSLSSTSYDADFYNTLIQKFLEKTENRDQVWLTQMYQVSMGLRLVSPVLELPQLSERLVSLVQNHKHTPELHIKMFDRLMTFFYKSNAKPDPAFLELFSKALYRDMETESGLSVVDSAIALAAFNSLPEYLAKDIFSSEFMSRLDIELNMFADNKAYITQLRYKLMVLNRCLVLQFPEFGVPWFHQNYCRDNPSQANSSITNYSLKNEVYEELCNVFGGWTYVRTNSLSEYSNPVHLEVWMDSEGHAMDLHQTELGEPAKKIAVQVYGELGYTQDTRKLQGELVLNNLHLSLQGWQVFTVNPFSWNSMYLADSVARKQYLQETVEALSN